MTNRDAPTDSLGRISLGQSAVEMDSILDELIKAYEAEDAVRWMFSQQKLLDGQIPYEMIKAGRSKEVRLAVSQMLE